MKYALLCVAVAGFIAAGNAQTSIGLNVHSSLTSVSHKDDNFPLSNSNSSDFIVIAGPILRIMLGSDREVDPYAGFSFSNTNSSNNSSSQLGFWLGCGYFFHAAHLGILTFSLGPDLSVDFYLPPSNSGSDYAKYGINAGVPLNFDFEFSRNVDIRISASAFTIGYSYLKSAGVSDDNASYNLESILMPSFTFFLTF
jgi:hypothetical protein